VDQCIVRLEDFIGICIYQGGLDKVTITPTLEEIFDRFFDGRVPTLHEVSVEAMPVLSGKEVK